MSSTVFETIPATPPPNPIECVQSEPKSLESALLKLSEKRLPAPLLKPSPSKSSSNVNGLQSSSIPLYGTSVFPG